MKKAIIASSLLLILLTLTSCNEDNWEENKKITKEEEIYMGHCSNCHGGNLQGSFGPALKKAGSKYNEEQLLGIIKKGKGNMPPQNYIDKADQELLASWLSNKK